MKFLKKLLIILIILLVLLLGLVGACAVNPELSTRIAAVLYGDDDSPGLFSKGSSLGITSSDGKSGADPLAGSVSNADIEIADINMPDVNSYDSVHPNNGVPEGHGGDDLPEGYEKYTAPLESSIHVPQGVSGRTGYEEPKETRRDITDKEADDLINSLGYGETGDDLSFDELYYPYYYMLDDDGKSLYKQIYANAKALNKSFAPIVTCTPDEVKDVFSAVFNDHPELFYVDTAYALTCASNGTVAGIELSFNSCANDLSSSKAQFDAAAENILSTARTLGSDFEKEKYVHDALTDIIDYNTAAPMNQSAYSALVNGSTVCAGYARAFQYLMQQLGIPCYYCTGYAGESHAWDIVKLDNDYYNVDVTWDDTDSGNYDYFNKPDSEFNETHMRKDLSVNLPACNGTNYQVASDGGSALSNASDGASNGGSSGQTYYGDTLPLAADMGFNDADILYDINSYYANCLSAIKEAGKGSYTFNNVIAGSDLLGELQSVYSSDAYKDGYIYDAMDAIGATSLRMGITVTPLQGDKYMISHNMAFE